MFEELYIYTILLQTGLSENEAYNNYLDDLFLKHPDHELLIELEWSVSDLNHTIHCIQEYVLENPIDYDSMGRLLCEKLEAVYDSAETDIAYFAGKMYDVWRLLPREISRTDPFFILSYADDPLSWGDEQQTRDLYQHMFNFYKEQ